jgi:hypothetical protein
MRRPLGCFTFSALVAAVLALVAVLAIAVASGNGLFSPGQLSAVVHGTPVGGVGSHAELEGRCDACHTAPWSGERMADRCLACHTQVQQEIASKGGLHGRFATTATCRTCHTDHRGVAASLTLANPSVFPHDQTGYSLQAHPLRGQGGSFTCVDCHPGSPTAFSPPACVACHQALDAPFMAAHLETFGTVCLNCHDGIDTYGKAFDHATYPLVGGHETAPCIACHRGATTLAALQTTPTECVACHATKDIHKGRLGTSCGECHSTNDWTSATIDHNLTRFPLTGKHVGTLCAFCHVERKWTGIGLTCRSCHANVDPHGNQFKGDCAACHVATGWKDITFDHATTRFKLVLAHAKPACAACHPSGKFVGTPVSCIACHAKDDRHKGAFGKDCAACHKATTWADVTFDHSKSSFPLTGAHRSVNCQACHKGNVFKGTPTACSSCHAKPSSHGSGFGNNCGSCHSTKAWRPASFNGPHPFPMRHGGAGGVCARCHPSSLTSYSCARCHSNASMSGRHREVSGFSLSGCVRCHPRGQAGD